MKNVFVEQFLLQLWQGHQYPITSILAEREAIKTILNQKQEQHNIKMLQQCDNSTVLSDVSKNS